MQPTNGQFSALPSIEYEESFSRVTERERERERETDRQRQRERVSERERANSSTEQVLLLFYFDPSICFLNFGSLM